MDSPVMVVEEEVMSDVRESIEGMYQRDVSKGCIKERNVSWNKEQRS